MPLDTIEENLLALIQLQAADSALDDLARARQDALDTIDLSEAKLKSFQARSEEEKKAFLELQKQHKTLEIEVAALETKMTKYQTQLFEVKTNKEYDALKQEIEKAKADKSRIEDRILEGLFKQDEQKKKIETMGKQIEEDKKRAAEEKKALQARVAECDATAAVKRKESEKLLASVDTEFAESYTQLRDSGKKVAVAEVTDEKMCSGCRMSVPPQTIIEVGRASQIVRCSCGRILHVKD